MKILNLMLFFSLIYGSHAFAFETFDRAAITLKISHYAEKTPKKLRFEILEDLATFSEMELASADAELIQNVLKTLIRIEQFDIPRSGALTVSDSYGRHKDLYRQAAAAIETKKNKELLKELLQIMEKFFENGNG